MSLLTRHDTKQFAGRKLLCKLMDEELSLNILTWNIRQANRQNWLVLTIHTWTMPKVSILILIHLKHNAVDEPEVRLLAS